ncbi:major tail protein [Oceanobacillus oncorhynchi]|uniref:major tail protein n=1 Tax=Oceanobacillus oncorhynchi TaxID=545501 RepID=UPI0025A3E2ED|nr:major tail protein [Oceanobacillus oncorhynchi]MDM8098660.1 phage tail protein [Oceanobacillus oncorhynchi]
MAEPKINQPHKATTGVKHFDYKVIGDEAAKINRVNFLQSIGVTMEQEIVKAYGDNTTAEMATSSGDIEVTGGFHKVPLQDKVRMLGWEESENGLIGTGGNDNPPYVGVIFTQTYEDGSAEYVGLPKGIFTRPSIEKETKGESTEFSSDEISGQFQDDKVPGFSDDKSVIFAYDPKGETTQRDAIYQAIFGEPHPDADEDGNQGGVEG